jgi:hypothetical protein
VKVAWQAGRRAVVFRFDLEDGDIPVRPRARMLRHRFSVEVPIDLDRVHRDLLALSAYLAVRPFVGDRIRFPAGISGLLAERLGHDAGPVDPSLEPRPIPPQGVPALAFSGGVDSTAALAVLPESTHAVHLLRVIPGVLAWAERARRVARPGRHRMHPETGLAAVTALAEAGRATHVAPSDLEFVRYPVGFPVDVANAIPALLLADREGFDSIAFGTVFESAYQVGKKAFTDYRATEHHRHYGGLFAAVGLPFHQVVAGVSEIGTTRIAAASPFGPAAQSCHRGPPGKPCMTCVKCFRKTLIDLAATGEQPGDALLDRFFASPQVRAEITKVWVKHENVYAYATAGYRGGHPLMTALRRRVRGDLLEVDWMERWYPPAAALLPEHRRAEAVAALGTAIAPMTPGQQAAAESWDLASALETQEYRRRRQALTGALSRNG